MCNWWYWWESSSGLEDRDITGSYITLYTGPNPPSPSLFPDEKLSVAATIWAKLKTCGLEYSSLLSKAGFPLTERNAKGNVILFFFLFWFRLYNRMLQCGWGLPWEKFSFLLRQYIPVAIRRIAATVADNRITSNCSLLCWFFSSSLAVNEVNRKF